MRKLHATTQPASTSKTNDYAAAISASEAHVHPRPNRPAAQVAHTHRLAKGDVVRHAFVLCVGDQRVGRDFREMPKHRLHGDEQFAIFELLQLRRDDPSAVLIVMHGCRMLAQSNGIAYNPFTRLARMERVPLMYICKAARSAASEAHRDTG